MDTQSRTFTSFLGFNQVIFHLTFWYSRRPTTLKERSDWPRCGWVVRVCPADSASSLLKFSSPNPHLTPVRTEGRMARCVNMVLCEVTRHLRINFQNFLCLCIYPEILLLLHSFLLNNHELSFFSFD
jgi:hypothetical protein